MDFFEQDDYKATVRNLIKSQSGPRRLTLKRISELIRIQYTYLSKALNDAKTHLGEDHLFSLCRALQLHPEEIDYILLLRSRAVSSDPTRVKYLDDRLNRIRRARQVKADLREFDSRKLTQEMTYLFDPLCLVVMISLGIPEIFEAPARLCPLLGITHASLHEILRKLAELGFLELADSKLRIRKLLRPQFHYGTDHPLMRVHQFLLKSACATQLLRTPEEHKHSFMATFSGDPETFTRTRARFQEFVASVEKVAVRARPRHTYQISFDLFRWL